MDTSETYIKMCEKAEEIQGQHKIEDGDFYFRKLPSEKRGDWYISYTSFEHDYSVEHPDQWDYLHGKIIWLPRQDQLQEMVKGQYDQRLLPSAMVGEFECFIFEDGELLCNDYARKFTSMEQLWLAFVMKEKHNKVWDGENWA